MGTRVDLVGKRYGKLVVIREDLSERPPGRVVWVCQCDCGGTKSISGNNLSSGKTRSCGCLYKVSMALNFSKARRVWIEYNGEKLCQAQFLRKFGHESVKIDVFRRRLRDGIDPYRAATEPLHQSTLGAAGDPELPVEKVA